VTGAESTKSNQSIPTSRATWRTTRSPTARCFTAGSQTSSLTAPLGTVASGALARHWVANSFGQLDVPRGSFVAVSAGGWRSCRARRRNRRLLG